MSETETNGQIEHQQSVTADAVARVLIEGDLSKLRPHERIAHYKAVCESLGLHPATKPFEYLKLNGKETLYARKDATDQLRKLHCVSIEILARETADGVHVVRARASMPDGRRDESVGAVNVEGLKGESLANALMKAETKAKRRATLSICGLGFLDETETETIPRAVRQESVPPPPSMAEADEAFEQVMQHLEDGELDAARAIANAWRHEFTAEEAAAIRVSIAKVEKREEA